MKQKHILEIPDNVETAFFTMRDSTGAIYSGVAKGQPHYTESLAMAFGTFAAILQGLESLDGPEKKIARDLRNVMREQTVEQTTEMLTKVAGATRKFLDEEGGIE